MAATIPTNGIVLSSGLNVADGDITLASGHGISFAATGDGTNDDSELFDDFEEGTWTGQYKSSSGNMTMNSTNKYGRYVKIGRMVHFWGYMGASAVGSATTGQGLQMTGLPFNITNHANDYNVISIGYRSGLALGASTTGVTAYIEISNSTIVFNTANDATASSGNFYVSNLSSDGHMMMTGTYLTD